MTEKHLAIGVLLSVLACSDPRSTKIPADMSDLPKIQSALDKLDSADRRRVGAYEMRARLGGLFGGSAPAAGGVTIGEAIKNQTAFEAAEARKATADSIVTAAAAKERAEKMRLMGEALATTLTKLEVQGALSDSYGQFIYMHVAFQNRGAKPIAGVKGLAIIRDMFGDTIARRLISYDKGIPINGSKSLRELIGATRVDPGDRRLSETPIEKLKFTFEPSIIIFDDGTKLEASSTE